MLPTQVPTTGAAAPAVAKLTTPPNHDCAADDDHGDTPSYYANKRHSSRTSIGIDYVSEGFPAGSVVTNRSRSLQTTWDELLWCAVTVGRPNRQFVFQHGQSSMYEALFRWSLIRTAVEQNPRGRRFIRTDAAKTLDPSEKGALHYFLGMTACKLFSSRLLNAPSVMHLDLFKSQLNPRILTGRSRPDLVGETNTGDWVVLESKGRVSVPDAKAKTSAKIQAQRVVSINGVTPVIAAGCITYFRSDVLQFFWRDPPAGSSRGGKEIELRVDADDARRHYYRPVLTLIEARDATAAMLTTGALLQVDEAHLQVGVHPKVLSLLRDRRWSEAKSWAVEHPDTLGSKGYQTDGIRVVAGESWFARFDERA